MVFNALNNTLTLEKDTIFRKLLKYNIIYYFKIILENLKMFYGGIT
jgi:hypothetical protein